jgi:hypothetical protein
MTAGDSMALVIPSSTMTAPMANREPALNRVRAINARVIMLLAKSMPAIKFRRLNRSAIAPPMGESSSGLADMAYSTEKISAGRPRDGELARLRKEVKALKEAV